MFSEQNIIDIITLLKQHYYQIESSSIYNIQRIPIGVDAQIYSFEVNYNNTTIKFLLKLFRNRLPKERAENEYKNTHKLYSSQINVPKVFGFRANECSFKRPFMLMEFISGQLLGTLVYNNITNDNIFFNAFIENLVKIHAVTWKQYFDEIKVPDIGTDPYIIIKSIITRTNQLVQEFTINEFVPVLDWLQTNMKEYPCNKLVFSHGDYHPGNIILNSQNELVTLDWSNVGLSDRRIDIAFAIIVLNSESNLVSDNLVISTYESITNVKIEGIEYFKVLTSLFNFLRMYSAACNYLITQETDETKETFLHGYKNYCFQVLQIMKNQVKSNFPTIENFLIN